MINLWLFTFHSVDTSHIVNIEKPWPFDEAIKHDEWKNGNGWWNARVMEHGTWFLVPKRKEVECRTNWLQMGVKVKYKYDG